MRIVLTTNSLMIGGAEQFVLRLANALAAREHEVTVVSERGPLVDELAPGIRHREAPMRYSRALFAQVAAMRMAFEESRAEVIHANSFNSAIAAALARGGRPIPLVTSAHGVVGAWKKPAIASWYALSSQAVVGCSARVTAEMERYAIRRPQALTIYNGFAGGAVALTGEERAALRQTFGVAPEAPLILSAGRLTPAKGFPHLLAAMPQVLAAHPEARLAIAGAGDLRDALERQAAEAGLEAAVRFLGTRRDVDHLMAAADLYCQSSVTEGLPMAVIEAMAAGLPVVATAVGGLPELVLDGQTGLLVPPGRPEALASALVRLLDDRTRAMAMGLAGRARVEAHFTLDQMVGAFENLYRALIAAGGQNKGPGEPGPRAVFTR